MPRRFRKRGKKGHVKRDCLDKSPRCDVCTGKGHVWSDCPDICHIDCEDSFEHLASDCPDRCYVCDVNEHEWSDCPKICHQDCLDSYEHLASDCPDRCYVCGDNEHEWSDCPEICHQDCLDSFEHLISDCPGIFDWEHEWSYFDNLCLKSGNSLQLSLPQSSSKAVVPPTSSNVVKPPSSKAVAPPTSYNAVAPPTSYKAVAPPTSSKAVAPPTSYTVVPPHTSNAVAPPPSSKAGLPLPLSSNAVVQPTYMVVPPRTSNAVVPPSSNVVVTLTSSNVVPPSSSRAVVPPSSKAVLPPPSSNADEIPSHWKISREYRTLEDAVTGLWNQELKFKMFRVDAEEQAEIEQLLHATWKQDVVGIGSDARNLGHTSIQVEKVERVENPEMYERYSEKKRKLLRRLRDPKLGDTAFTSVVRLPYSSGPVLTTTKMDSNSRILRRNTEPKINEYYLFHGTKQEFANIIARDGMDNRFGSQNALLGAGLYTAESCTKADQYTDVKTSRSSGQHRMFLVRVLLGKMYVNTNKDPPKYKRPPCQSCQQSMCNCPHTQHYDSVMDNYHRRLFREFVVYEQCQCYPEYLITYTRVGGASHYQPPPTRPAIPVAAAAAPRQRATFAPTAPPPRANPNPAEKKCAVM